MNLQPVSDHNPTSFVEKVPPPVKSIKGARHEQIKIPKPTNPSLQGKTITLGKLSDQTVKKTEQVSLSVFHHIKKYSGIFSDGFLDFLNYIGLGFIAKLVAVRLEGIGYVGTKNIESLSKHVITHLTGDEKIGEKFKTKGDVHSKIQYFIHKHKGIEGFQAKLEKANTLDLHRFKNLTYVDVLCTLDELDPADLKQIPYSDKITADVIKFLRPGDILFFQHREDNPDKTVRAIKMGQKVAQLWLKGELDPQSETHTHVAIYIGQGKFAEAVSSKTKEDVRIVSFDDYEKMQLKQGDGRSYRISRLQNTQIAKEAARLAKKYAEDKVPIKKGISLLKDIALLPNASRKEKIIELFKLGTENLVALAKKIKESRPINYLTTQLRYSIRKAFGSLFGNANFNSEARAHIWRQVVEMHNNRKLPLDKQGNRLEFFCSELVTECIQRANVKVLLPWISSKINEPIPTFTRNKKADIKNMDRWVAKMMKEHPHLLDKMLMQFHPQFVSPQKLRSLVESNPHLFKDVATIVPPKTTEPIS